MATTEADPGRPEREVRARYDDVTITVYQAYAPAIADAALAAGRFVPPFRRARMTWVKPSFLWMMYRSGWATKPGQERVVGVSITRAGFEWALSHACLSHFDPRVHRSRDEWALMLRASPVRVQWDPERSSTLAPLPYRAIQVGLSGEAVDRYVDDWIVDLVDVTPWVTELRALAEADVLARLPVERPYPVAAEVAARLGMGPQS